MTSYVLLIECKTDVIVRTKCREFFIRKGFYAYVGSCGRSCSKRISRHLNRSKNKYHWHIDYLTTVCEPIAVFVMKCVKEKELASLLSENNAYVEKFGSSDDRNVKSHLFIVSDLQKLCLAICNKSRK
ncbi:MAG: DUF123 domain-containing protein [Saccharolobus sp.]|uniref:GIY-YIG nuclease family protein n=1 Tax=Saccharolobus TaxID=2100760 RepID=UPI001F0F3F75|nr:DUF123 domain-containing protein [Saccharolobus shibatae]MCH4814633.1 DUF123 domain-containing protein [Saccharolobus shibatae]